MKGGAAMYANNPRNSYLETLSQHKFSYRIDVQPQGNVKIDALTQAMRQILFGLNRKYLGVRKWDKFTPERKFWALCMKEGDNLSTGVHYHLLLHCPVDRIDWINDILLAWSKLRLRPRKDASPYPTWVQTKGKFHVPCDALENVPLLRVERCKDVEASVVYNTKQWRPSAPENFIIGLSET
jgi:hypothetical protein